MVPPAITSTPGGGLPATGSGLATSLGAAGLPAFHLGLALLIVSRRRRRDVDDPT